MTAQKSQKGLLQKSQKAQKGGNLSLAAAYPAAGPPATAPGFHHPPGQIRPPRAPGGVVQSWYAVLCPLCCQYAPYNTL